MAKQVSLNVAQRVNLKAVLENRQPVSAGDGRLLFKLIDKVGLTPDEELKCGYHVDDVGSPTMGQKIYRWSPEGNFETEFSFEDAEYDKLREIFSGPVPGINGTMRSWYEPLLTSLGL